jgi:hypothetical protein
VAENRQERIAKGEVKYIRSRIGKLQKRVNDKTDTLAGNKYDLSGKSDKSR